MTERRIRTFLAAAALAAGVLSYTASAQAFAHGGGFHAGGFHGGMGGFQGGMGGFHGGFVPGHGFGRGFGHRAFGFSGYGGYPYYAGDWGYGYGGDCWQTQLVWNGYRWVPMCVDY
jgi:hypothetical protein